MVARCHEAESRYRPTLLPFVEKIQAAVNRPLLRVGMPSSRVGVGALRVVAALAALLHVPSLVDRFAKDDRGGNWQLPRYPVGAAG